MTAQGQDGLPTASEEVVWRRDAPPLGSWALLEGSSASALLAIVSNADAAQRASFVVAIDHAVTAADHETDDALIALAAVLADLGVGGMRTSRPAIARRVFDMHRAIEAGHVEVLQ